MFDFPTRTIPDSYGDRAEIFLHEYQSAVHFLLGTPDDGDWSELVYTPNAARRLAGDFLAAADAVDARRARHFSGQG